MSHQDWEPLTIRNTAATVAARRTMATVQAGGKHNPLADEMRKIEQADGGKPKMLTPKSRTDMAAARAAKKLLQKDVDRLGSFPLNSCNMWEAGRLCPTSQQVQALHRLLGVKLERA